MADFVFDVSAVDGGLSYRRQNEQRCACGGHYFGVNTNRHVVWLAFAPADPTLSYFSTARWLSSMAGWLGRTDITHCQFVFYDHQQARFYTYSVDKRNKVSVSHTKKFERTGWRFLQIEVSEQQEVAIRNALAAELDKDFDFSATLWLYFWPRKTTRRAWFCSELMLTALKAAGLAQDAPEPYRMPPHRLFYYMLDCFGARCRRLVAKNASGQEVWTNPVTLNDRILSGSIKYQF